MSEMQFKPAWWLPGPHLQTLWATLARNSGEKLPLIRERIELPDGDFVDLDWTTQEAKPIVMILHGLEGSSDSPYAQGMLRAIDKKGWRGVVMHFRGCSGERNRLPHAYHSGETTDIATVINVLRAREPQTVMTAIGFSLGGNVLLKWLGESASENPLRAAVAISVPFVLQETAQRLQKGFSRVYQWHLLKCLCEKMQTKSEVKSALNFSLEELKTLYEFDDRITAPMHGFTGADDYYEKSSSRQFLKTIEVPTLLLQAKDDPFMTEAVIPSAQELSATTTLQVTESGGHVGFVAGNSPLRPQYWLEQRVMGFLEKYI